MGNLGIAVAASTARARWARPFALVALAALVATGFVALDSPLRVEAASPCGAQINPVVCENQKPGTDPGEWDIHGAGDPTIQGFATDISVNAGDPIDFKIDTDADEYTIDIYRTGWYQGLGARYIDSVDPSAPLPQIQPECISDVTTELYDCGTWAVSGSWDVPTDAASGVYLARLERSDTGGASHITFIVRKDGNTSDVLFQTSDPTWHAYNSYGGSDFYQGAANGRAYKISYNRPFATRSLFGGRDFYFSAEYATVRFLERNGYDVSYLAGVDTDRRGGELLNHDVFLSVGHDEYWSGAQRANIEAARDAGVNLQFLTGNEAYWRTRYEPSADASATSHRTLVSYKETWSNGKIDPSTEWTGTWRDPRFADATRGGHLPENQLTGTAFFVNEVDLPVTVSSEEGKLRLWRDTALADIPTGTNRQLAPHTIGYESNEDIDNGFRPAGLIRLSTTVGPAPQRLMDYGSVVVPGDTEHHLTLYRAPSGALVFSAASIQWGWGLDEEHDGNGAPADPRMQQAQVNLLADMGAQPGSLMSTLSAATASTDTSPPLTTIVSPTDGQALAHGQSVTVTGTASDVGGRVAGVEVSTDGGRTWHPAAGTTSWSYTYVQQGNAQATIIARAIDDSANYAPDGVTRTVAVTGAASVFGQETPSLASADDTQAVELGLRFVPESDGFVTGVRFYKGSGNTGNHTGTVWSAEGERMGSVAFSSETATGWQEAHFDTPVAVFAGTSYVVSYTAPDGGYAYVPRYWPYAARNSSPLVPDVQAAGGPAAYGHPGAFPSQTWDASNYFVDAIFETAPSTPLRVSERSPAPGATGVAPDTDITAVFSREVDAATVGLTVSGPDTALDGTVSYDAATRTVRFAPGAALSFSTTYTVTLTAEPTTGAGLTAAEQWSFTTAAAALPPGECPCSIYSDSDVPTISSFPDSAVTVGTRFRVTEAGSITAIRFYKGSANPGPHTGALWTAAGESLAEATFVAESESGWQTAILDEPVDVSPGVEYVVSYTAPHGGYSATPGAFASEYVRGPLVVPASGGAYTYGGGFPDSRSTAGYFVDVIFDRQAGGPRLVATTPADGATDVDADAVISATFDAEPADTATISVVAGGAQITGTSATSGHTVTFTPDSALPEGAVVTATVVDGGAGPGRSWSFSVEAGATAGDPVTLFGDESPLVHSGNDGVSVELGTVFTAAVNGRVTALRFFKLAGDTGAHTGTLWGPDGQALATVAFTNETASGWQTAPLGTPVSLTAGTTYTVSFLSPQGRYPYASDFFAQPYSSGPLTATAGTFRYGGGGQRPTDSWQHSSYFADVAFAPGAPSAPAPEVTMRAPSGSAVARDMIVTATLSAAAASPSLTLTANGAGVAGSTAYDATSRTITFTPTDALAPATSYTATVRTGGLALDQWTFMTAEPDLSGTAESLFGDATPAIAAAADGIAVEVGTMFRVTQGGYVTAVRFYKGQGNSGTHVGTLWDGSGNRLATVTFENETETGWQRAALAHPVEVVPGATYGVSYLAPHGRYALETGYFTSERQSGSIVGLAGDNGRFRYGSDGGFPEGSWNSSAYFVDAEVTFPAGGGAPLLTPVPNPQAPSPAPEAAPSPAPEAAPSPAPEPEPVAGIATSTPAPGAGEVTPATTVSVVFDRDVHEPALVLMHGSVTISGATSYDAGARTLTFTPAAPLAWATEHTVRVAVDGATVTGGEWAFTTAAEPAMRTAQELFADDGDARGVQVGKRFSVAVPGEATGIRFFTGDAGAAAHTGYLWNADGTPLAEIVFAGEAASGWREAVFPERITLVPGVEYRVGLHSESGRYAVAPDTLAQPTAVGVFSAPQRGGAYALSAGFPAETSPDDYWVDVTFVPRE